MENLACKELIVYPSMISIIIHKQTQEANTREKALKLQDDTNNKNTVKLIFTWGIKRLFFFFNQSKNWISKADFQSEQYSKIPGSFKMILTLYGRNYMVCFSDIVGADQEILSSIFEIRI